MHVSKTAGTSVIAALEAVFAGHDVVRGFDRSLFGAFDDFASFGWPARRSVFMAASELAPADLVAGHFAFSTLRAAYPNARLMTVLREPMTRLLSLWIYWRQFPSCDLLEWGSWTDRVRLAARPLGAFLALPEIAAQTDNLLTRQLLWPHPLIPPDDFIDRIHDRRLLRLAAGRLREFAFVDFVERDGLAKRLGDWLGRPLSIERINTTETMPTHLRASLASELSGPTWARLCASSRLDDRLWSAVVGRRLGAAVVDRLRGQTIAAAVARYACLLQGPGEVRARARWAGRFPAQPQPRRATSSEAQPVRANLADRSATN